MTSAGNTVELLRNSQLGAYIYPVVPSEFTNFRREVIAWRETAVLYDQSHHMHNIFISGPDALKLITDTGINSTAKFPVDTAKQFVPVSPEGGVIGDGILFRESEEEFTFVGRAPVANWLLFKGSAGYNVDMVLDPRSPSRPYGKAVTRKLWRFQIQGPNAWAVIEKLNGEPMEQVRFFRMGWMNIGGEKVRTLRHGMAGAPGLEIWGPYESYDKIRDTILEAGVEFGLEPCGARAYSCNTLESGWIPSPLPAIYTSPGLRGYREWLGADSYEATNAIAGSFVSTNIEDYYTNPWELGYGGVREVRPRLHRPRRARGDRPRRAAAQGDPRLERRGPGRAADLAARAGRPATSSSTCRTRTTARPTSTPWWTRRARSSGCRCSPATRPTSGPGCRSPPSTPTCRSAPRSSVIWGEPDGGSRKTTVQPHEQFAVRAVVSPAPYSKVVQESYHEGWRSSLA